MSEQAQTQEEKCLREIVYVFQMLSINRSGGMRLITRDAAGYDTYVMQLRKNRNAPAQLIEYQQNKVAAANPDPELYRFVHWLHDWVQRSAKDQALSQLDMRFDHTSQALGDAAKLSWTIGRGQIALGSVW